MSEWEQDEDSPEIFWKRTEAVGEFIFSFDKKKEYNLFADYPYKLSKEEKEKFDKACPYWKKFFQDRQ